VHTTRLRLTHPPISTYDDQVSHEFAIRAIAACALLLLSLSLSAAGRPIAFPGAEGFGRHASGGRGGAVAYVTHLDDAGPGSLRAALAMPGPRTVMFAVSGTIHLQSPLLVSHGNLTIAGQTAPGGGITLANHPLKLRHVDNVIIRFIRVRLGDRSGIADDALDVQQCRDVIIDHCSFSWGTDEVASAYDNDNFTLQWCFITESLRDSVHAKGLHGYGGIWGGRGASFLYNLLAHHDSRNPRFNGARYHGTDAELVDFRNNVIYNWLSNSSYGGEPAPDGAPSRHNVVNNYYKPGPATKRPALRYRILNPSPLDARFGLFYVAGNVVADHPTVTADNWAGGVQHPPTVIPSALRAAQPFAVAPVTTRPATEALALVLAFGGAYLPHRDAVDARIISEVRDGTFTHRGSRGQVPGIIDSQADVGGWPQLPTASPPVDSDGDGMPDAWELAHGLNPHDPADRNLTADPSGFTQLEHYLNSLITASRPLP
jgi:hypothetical protein